MRQGRASQTLGVCVFEGEGKREEEINSRGFKQELQRRSNRCFREEGVTPGEALLASGPA